MIKYNKLKEKLTKESMMIAGIVIVLSGVGFGLSSYADSNQQDLTAANNSLQGVNAQIVEIERKSNIVSTSLDQFNSIKKRMDKKEFLLDTEVAQLKLNELRKKFLLSSATVAITDEKSLTTPALSRFSALVFSSRDVSITFKALTDLHVYSFINALKNEFPGFTKIYEVKISRLSKVNQSVKKGIVYAGQEPELIEATVKFYWLGFKLKTSEPAANAVTGGPANGI